MTKEQILEFNKKCVEFLDGYTFITAAEFNMLGEHSYTGEHKNTKWAIIEYLKYHRDWNSIMEIVEKIENLKHGVEIIGNYCHIINTDIYSTKVNKKEAIIDAIDRFLTDYLYDKGTDTRI